MQSFKKTFVPLLVASLFCSSVLPPKASAITSVHKVTISSKPTHITNMEFSQQLKQITKISNYIICSTSLNKDFLKLHNLIKLNNCFCGIFGIIPPDTGFIDFQNFDFNSIGLIYIGYGKIRKKVEVALEQTRTALEIFCERSKIIPTHKKVIKIKALLQSIIVALDAILYPDKYYLGELSD